MRSNIHRLLPTRLRWPHPCRAAPDTESTAPVEARLPGERNRGMMKTKSDQLIVDGENVICYHQHTDKFAYGCGEGVPSVAYGAAVHNFIGLVALQLPRIAQGITDCWLKNKGDGGLLNWAMAGTFDKNGGDVTWH